MMYSQPQPIHSYPYLLPIQTVQEGAHRSRNEKVVDEEDDHADPINRPKGSGWKEWFKDIFRLELHDDCSGDEVAVVNQNQQQQEQSTNNNNDDRNNNADDVDDIVPSNLTLLPLHKLIQLGDCDLIDHAERVFVNWYMDRNYNHDAWLYNYRPDILTDLYKNYINRCIQISDDELKLFPHALREGGREENGDLSFVYTLVSNILGNTKHFKREDVHVRDTKDTIAVGDNNIIDDGEDLVSFYPFHITLSPCQIW